MSHSLLRLLNLMFPEAGGWPSFSRACPTFPSEIDSELAKKLGQFAEAVETSGHLDDLDSAQAQMFKVDHELASILQMEATQSYFGSNLMSVVLKNFEPRKR